MFECEKY